MHGKTRNETLDYLQQMLTELRRLATSGGYNMVAYLIEMACIETADIARGERPSRIGKQGNGSTCVALKASGKI